jgi:eukaryotic-like serine/threonine-protein kinase
LAKDVPSVVGMPIADAHKEIDKVGYVPVEAKDGKISTFPIGTVAAQDPLGGKEAKPGSTVTLYASSGVWIRDFSGSTYSVAETEMSKTGVMKEKMMRRPELQRGL